jgi:hypothetical protein
MQATHFYFALRISISSGFVWAKSVRPLNTHWRFQDLTGRRFGRLVVVGYAGRAGNSSRGSMWLCRCDCGNATTVLRSSLVGDITRSCKCVMRATAARGRRTHGLCRTPENVIWNSMVKRCHNPKCLEYHNYGGRGIVVCDRWRGRTGFVNFLADVGPRPSPKHSIDRIDNDGGYEPANCRWATAEQQQLNTRRTVFVTFNGETKTILEWSRITGISYSALYQRIWHGWTAERALTEPSPTHINLPRPRR